MEAVVDDEPVTESRTSKALMVAVGVFWFLLLAFLWGFRVPWPWG